MATTVTNSSRGLVRVALALALAGLLAVLSGGLLMITGGSAASVTQDDMGVVYSQDPDNPTLVEEVPEGFEPYGEAVVTEDNCITTTVQVYSHLVSEATDGFYTAWVDEGEPVQTEEDVAPGEDTVFVQWLPADTVKVIDQEFVPGTPAQDTRVWWVLKGKDWDGDGVPPMDHPSWKEQPNLPSENSQHSYPGENGLGVPYQPGENEGNGDWFRFTGELIPAVPETPEVSHTEYLWQKQVRTFVEGNSAVVEYVYTTVSEGEPCDEETEPPEVLPTEETEPTEPNGPNGPNGSVDEPAGPNGPTDATGPEESPDVEVLGQQATRQGDATVPRAVDAGVGGRTTGAMWGAGLVGGGLVLLLTAGGALVGARRLEAA